MVVIYHCNPHQLYAYPTVHLGESVIASVQHDFAAGSFARFGNPDVTISVQDRPDFHGSFHYQIREKLDLEDLLGESLIIDDRTAHSHAVWYVRTTETSKYHTDMAIWSVYGGRRSGFHARETRYRRLRNMIGTVQYGRRMG